ncbi:hypothetical protein C2S53_008624 [Perilla frutescens var. hirtella]|uniref:Uncharacterized protein n=1 Tax=Perilla frutescens var. hirtella TaxID=608512 RepID=A0AAD4JD91_PERFH|nr:hypothetical protein C2S53_008624 [Perilla frutescens var. hirtella]
MGRNCAIVSALMVALVVAMVSAAADAKERNGNVHCMAECHTECMQIRIFNEDECKKDCALACARFAMKKALNEGADDIHFFPSWI